MTLPRSHAKQLLLDLVSATRRVDRTVLDQCTASDWEAILEMVRQHRLGPLLHWRLTQDRTDVSVPQNVRAELSKIFTAATVRALVCQRALTLCHQTLVAAGVEHIALKGAYLAFHAYPHPALRPLGDLDVLVPKPQALGAYQALIAEGWEQVDDGPWDLASYMSARDHFPALQLASANVALELHTRLMEPGVGSTLFETMLWDQRVSETTAGQTMAFLTPTYLLLHLIHHAIYHHMFSNGPLLLSDISYLLRTRTIDWPLFWKLADDRHWTRGCRLALGMTHEYDSGAEIVYPAPLRDGEQADLNRQIAAAALLTLDNPAMGLENRVDVSFQREKSLFGALGVAMRKLFPSQTEMAALYPVTPRSATMAAQYPLHWFRIATQRVPQHLAFVFDRKRTSEQRAIRQIDQWLRQSA